MHAYALYGTIKNEEELAMDEAKVKGKYTVNSICNGLTATSYEANNMQEVIGHILREFNHDNIISVHEVYCEKDIACNILVIYRDKDGDELTNQFVVEINK